MKRDNEKRTISNKPIDKILISPITKKINDINYISPSNILAMFE